MTLSRWFPVAAATLLLASGAWADDGKKPAKEGASSFGALKSDAAEARKQAEGWLKAAGKTDAASLDRFKKIWDGDAPLLDKLTQTLVIGEPAVAKMMADARNADENAPAKLPELLAKAKPGFFKNALALAYGKALTSRKVYEEALDALAMVKPENAADPAALFFHKAVCEHALMFKDGADKSIDRLLVDVGDSPERYRMVAALMHFDMLTWQEKDLGWIARKMGNIQRRLDLKRGGKETQKQQKEVLVRLDEMIKELENKAKNPPPPGGG